MLDSFARASLWQTGLDYMHGTGHGVGSFLNVHEGTCQGYIWAAGGRWWCHLLHCLCQWHVTITWLRGLYAESAYSSESLWRLACTEVVCWGVHWECDSWRLIEMIQNSRRNRNRDFFWRTQERAFSRQQTFLDILQDRVELGSDRERAKLLWRKAWSSVTVCTFSWFPAAHQGQGPPDAALAPSPGTRPPNKCTAWPRRWTSVDCSTGACCRIVN